MRFAGAIFGLVAVQGVPKGEVGEFVVNDVRNTFEWVGIFA
jgi:hypothetical protein